VRINQTRKAATQTTPLTDERKQKRETGESKCNRNRLQPENPGKVETATRSARDPLGLPIQSPEVCTRADENWRRQRRRERRVWCAVGFRWGCSLIAEAGRRGPSDRPHPPVCHDLASRQAPFPNQFIWAARRSASVGSFRARLRHLVGPNKLVVRE
jgi:hypothetical protein